MHTIALVNQKGGVGKTTLAVHLATAFQNSGESVLVLDLDPQASATEWHDARESEMPHVESVQPARLQKVMDHAQGIGITVLILDTSPHAESTALEAARRADLVLVPVAPKIMDLRAMRKTVDMLHLVKTPAFAVLNNVPHKGNAAEEAIQVIEGRFKLPIAPPRLGNRVAFDRCLITGQTAPEYEPNGKAAQELEHLHKWTRKQLDMST